MHVKEEAVIVVTTLGITACIDDPQTMLVVRVSRGFQSGAAEN
jgi:hypothetical protein